MAHPAAKAPLDVALLLTFECKDVRPYLGAIFNAASHVPKYWAVESAQRDDLKHIFAKLAEHPLVAGSSVLWQASFDRGELSCGAELTMEFLRERAAGHRGKFFLTGDPACPKLFCQLAAGGLKEEVHTAATFAIASQTISGYFHHEDS